MSGKLRVNAPIFGYNYTNDEDGNIASFIFDKPGSHFTGIGSNGETDTIYFGAVSSSDTGVWNNNYKQKWKFNGSIIADSITGNLIGNATSATTASSVAWDNVSGKPSAFPPSSHTHTKSQITDFPTSMPASDVYSWAKAKSKPSYTADDVGAIAIDGGNVLGDIAFDLEEDSCFTYNGSEVATKASLSGYATTSSLAEVVTEVGALRDDVELIKEQIACFRGDTQILMADGSTKDIKDVKYGDMIKSYDIENDCLVDVKSYGAYATGFE